MKNKTNQKQALFKLIKRLKKYWLFILASVILAAVSSGLTLYVPIIIGNAIDLISGKGQVNFSAVGKLLSKTLVIVSVTGVIQWVMNSINNKVSYSVIKDMRMKAFKKIEELPLSYIDSHPHGEMVSRVITDADQLSDGLLLAFSQLFTGVVIILGTLLFMSMINIRIALLVVVLTPISLFVASYISKHTFDMFKMQSHTRGEQTALINEMIGNRKIVSAFSYEDEAVKKFNEVNDRLEKHSLQAVFYSSLTNPCTRFVNSMVYAAVGLTGAIAAINGNLTVGGLSCLLSYANQYTKPFNEISGVIAELQNALAGAQRLFDFIEEKPQSPSGEKVLLNPEGKIEIENVSFSYTAQKKLIENFNLCVKPGQRIAIVGPTGCGKTTIINLLMRFYDTTKGEIFVDGLEIRDITRKSLRENYGMVLQETWLKHGSIRENIIMGKPQATEEEIIEAAKASHAHSFIKRLPDGYDTIIGEDGGSLSGGQKQLLCITRVMLCLPPMLILDEATSSIDTRTELKIQNAFSKLMQGKTSFIVAHRLSTIREADVILVMNDGNIVEKGTHEELLQKNGFYTKLYNSQYE